jgi:hypothetical protein
MATCGIAAEDDDGNAASRPATTYAAPAKPAPRTTDAPAAAPKARQSTKAAPIQEAAARIPF